MRHALLQMTAVCACAFSCPTSDKLFPVTLCTSKVKAKVYVEYWAQTQVQIIFDNYFKDQKIFFKHFKILFVPVLVSVTCPCCLFSLRKVHRHSTITTRAGLKTGSSKHRQVHSFPVSVAFICNTGDTTTLDK